MGSSAREIVELNIRHYLKRLEIETDPRTRQTIRKLLKEEEATLAKLIQAAKPR